MHKKLLLSLIIVLSFYFQSKAQTDNCSGTLVLPVNNTCVTTNYNVTSGFTDSMADPSCGTSERDGWATFTTDATTTQVDIIGTSNRRLGIALYSGNCGALTEVACSIPNAADASLTNIAVTASTTYYVRLMRTNNGGGDMTGTICIVNTTSNSNDTCATATTLNCGDTNIVGTTVGASNPANGTGCIISDYGAWYTFVGDGDQTTITVNPAAGFDAEIAIESGSCGALTNITCEDDPETYTFTTTLGVTYFVYVAYWTTGSTNTGDFTISRSCTTPPPPPPNDDCLNATTLNCGDTNIAGTTVGASNTPNGTGCGLSDYGVWYTFAGDGDDTTITVNSVGGFDVEVAIESGSCGTFTNLSCEDNGNPESFTFPTVIGTNYYVYVAYWFAGDTDTGDFTISRSCTPPPPPPTNLDCTSAETLVCGQTENNETTTGTTGTNPNGTGCTMSDYGVWYYHEGTGNQTTFTVTPTGGFDPAMAIMRGTCDGSGNFTLINNITCQDGFGIETFTFTTTLGVDYYIYVAHYSDTGSVTGNFGIEISCTPPNCTAGSGTGTSPVGLSNLTLADSNGNNPASLVCGATGTLDLEATYLQIGDPSNYSVSNIAYAPPYQYDCLSNIFTIFNDDEWSNDVPIGFDFCFYDNATANALTTLNMGANGVITFEGPTGGDDTGWDINYNVPNAINAEDFSFNYFYGRSIYGVHHDINPGTGGELGYELITLDTGERALIASWHDVPMFGNSNSLYTGMIVLYEHTNIIDVFIEEKNVYASWNDGNASIAVQRDATTAVVPPNRNSLDPNWTATNEAWRFTPTGGGLGSISTITWYDGSAAANGGTTTGLPVEDATNSDIITITPAAGDIYTAEVVYTFCDGTTLNVIEEIAIQTATTKTWDGSESNNWYDANNWTPAGVPNSADCVIIPDAATTNNDPIADIADIPIPLPPVPAYAGNLTVQNSGYLAINADTHLVVTDWVNTTNGNGILDIRDSGSLIQVNDAATNSGAIHVQRSPKFNQGPVLSSEYVYWSSPVQTTDVSSISPGTGANYIWEWDATVNGNGIGNHGDWNNVTGNMPIAKGAIIRGLSGTPTVIPGTAYGVTTNTALFSGAPNNGVITRQIFHGNYDAPGDPGYQGNSSTGALAYNNDDNWNLIGNPYPSAISANAFTNLNSDINGTVYLWPHTSASDNAVVDPFYDDYVYNYNANDYVEHNNTGSNPPGTNDLYIASGQAFFVLMNHASTSGANVLFDNSMREITSNYDNGNFYDPINNNDNRNTDDTIERNRIWLDLITSENVANTVLIGYIEGATNQFDRRFDGYEFAGSSISFYSINAIDKMSIQGRGLPFDDNDTVPLGMVIPNSDIYSIAINTVDGLFENEAQGLYLEDLYTNTIHDLRSNPYSFTSEAGQFDDRFILRYTYDTLSTSEFEDNSGIAIISTNNDIQVTSRNLPIKDITIYDLIGRRIVDLENLNALEHTISDLQLSKSAYIIKVSLYNGRQVIKKIVH